MTHAVQIAVAGFGYWGANLARNIASHESADLVAIADPSLERLQHATSLYPQVPTYKRTDDLLAIGDIDAVVVSTPPSTHAKLALQAIEAGKHVLVEKPLATSAEDALKAVRAARRNGRVLMVGHTFLYSPPIRLLRELVQRGDLGEIQYLYSQRLSLGRIRRDCNVLWNLAPHDISILGFLLDDWPTVVSATGHAFVDPPIEDVFFVSALYSGRVAANVHVSWIDPSKTRKLTVVGDRKMAVFNDVSADAKITVFDAGLARGQRDGLGPYESYGDFQWRTRTGDIWIPRVEMTEPLRLEIDDVVAACRGSVKPAADSLSGLHTVQVLEAAARSAQRGGAPVPVTLGVDGEES